MCLYVCFVCLCLCVLLGVACSFPLSPLTTRTPASHHPINMLRIKDQLRHRQIIHHCGDDLCYSQLCDFAEPIVQFLSNLDLSVSVNYSPATSSAVSSSVFGLPPPALHHSGSPSPQNKSYPFKLLNIVLNIATDFQ